MEKTNEEAREKRIVRVAARKPQFDAEVYTLAALQLI